MTCTTVPFEKYSDEALAEACKIAAWECLFGGGDNEIMAGKYYAICAEIERRSEAQNVA